MEAIVVSVLNQTVTMNGQLYSFREVGFLENLGDLLVPLGSGEIRDLIAANYPEVEIEFTDLWEGVWIYWEMDHTGRMIARIKKSLAHKLHERMIPSIPPEQMIANYQLTSNGVNALFLKHRDSGQLVPVCKRETARAVL